MNFIWMSMYELQVKASHHPYAHNGVLYSEVSVDSKAGEHIGGLSTFTE